MFYKIVCLIISILDHHDHFIGKRDTIPNYCDNLPILQSPSPVQGAVIPIPESGGTIELSAQSQNGAITRFLYQNPIGMQCSAVDGNGNVQCNFTPNESQKNQVWVIIQLKFCVIFSLLFLKPQGRPT